MKYYSLARQRRQVAIVNTQFDLIWLPWLARAAVSVAREKKGQFNLFIIQIWFLFNRYHLRRERDSEIRIPLLCVQWKFNFDWFHYCLTRLSLDTRYLRVQWGRSNNKKCAKKTNNIDRKSRNKDIFPLSPCARPLLRLLIFRAQKKRVYLMIAARWALVVEHSGNLPKVI